MECWKFGQRLSRGFCGAVGELSAFATVTVFEAQMWSSSSVLEMEIPMRIVSSY